MKLSKQMILGLSEEYTLVCVIDTKTGRDTVTRMNERRAELIDRWDDIRTFNERMLRVADAFVDASDRDRFLRETATERAMEELDSRESFTVRYKVMYGGRRENWMVRFFRQDRSARYILAAFRNVEEFTDALPVIESITGSMPGGFFICHADQSEKLIFFNDLMISLLGCDSREEFIVHTGNSFQDIVHPGDLAETERSIATQTRENDRGIFHVICRARRKDGVIAWLECYGRLVRADLSGDVFYVFTVDVTENYEKRRTAYSAELREEERRRMRREISAGNTAVLSERMFEDRRVLLVDDSDITLEVNRGILEDQGAEVTVARHGREALDMVIAGRRFDFILMDLVMPVMNGVDATREIVRLQNATGHIAPVIILTSDGSDTQVKDALKAGACEVLYKPLNITELSRTLIAQMSAASGHFARQLDQSSGRTNTDPLTKVKNIMAYTDQVASLSSEMARSSEFRMGVILCDCDGLQQVNATHGHDAGDLFICNCSRIICAVFAHSPVYRIGGDEFAVILSGVDLIVLNDIDLRQVQYLNINDVINVAVNSYPQLVIIRFSCTEDLNNGTGDLSQLIAELVRRPDQIRVIHMCV